jgi:hypothetical protein
MIDDNNQQVVVWLTIHTTLCLIQGLTYRAVRWLWPQPDDDKLLWIFFVIANFVITNAYSSHVQRTQ